MGKEPALPKNIRQIGEISGREKVCIEDYVMTYIHKREQQEEKGYLCLFFGERQETEDSVYVFIRGIFEVSTEMQEPQGAEELRKEYENCFGDWAVQGCCVIGAYPTERMKALAAWFPDSGKLIFHLQEQEETLYWTGEDQYRRLKGYFVFYEQNRKMQEYLSKIFGSNSVEKESPPDRAIHSFREKVKEKGEQKQNNFLRMASSFFVITILIIGAIVVNRIEDIRAVRDSDAQDEASLYAAQQEEEAVKSSTVSGNQAYWEVAEETELAGSDAFWEDSDLEDTEAVTEQQEETDGTEKESTGIGESPVAENAMSAEVQTESVSEDPAVSEQISLEDPAAETEASQEAMAVRHTQAGYVIKEGDTLAKICSNYYGSMERIEEVCEANGIEDANMILPGQRIVLP